MRKQFVNWLYDEMVKNDKIYLLTGDLGYGLFDNIRKDFPTRFKNVGSSEQLMIGIATGLSYEGYIPICYSITPFLLYRPFELIRNYLNKEGANVKLVGGGRDDEYKSCGWSHWAHEDTEIMKVLSNVKVFKPDVLSIEILNEVLYSNCPCYINLKR